MKANNVTNEIHTAASDNAHDNEDNKADVLLT